MSIKLGIYDFFAYMIPGGIAIAAFLFVLINRFGLIIDFTQLSATHILLFGILSYLSGYVVDAISGRMWLDFFHPKNLFEKTINEFNERNPSIKVSLKEMDWYIVFTYIKKQSIDIADTIDKLNAQSKMLKNSGFGAVIFSIIFLVEFFSSKYHVNNLLLSIACLVVAIILAKQAVKFRSWFYVSIYQSYVGIISEPEFLPVKIIPKAKVTSKKKMVS